MTDVRIMKVQKYKWFTDGNSLLYNRRRLQQHHGNLGQHIQWKVKICKHLRKSYIDIYGPPFVVFRRTD
jgi:hypothetical protein